MKKIDNFINAEIKERQMLNKIIPILDMKIETIFEPQNYDTADFTAYIKREYILGEIKVRNFEHDKYPTAYLELDKLNRLMIENKDAYIQESRIPYLYSFYEDNTVLIFNLMTTPFTIEYQYVNKCTMDPSKGKEYKAFIALPIENGKKITF